MDGVISFLNLFSTNYKLKTEWKSNATEEGPSASADDVAEADVHQTHRTRPKVDSRIMPISTPAGNEEKGDVNVNYGLQLRAISSCLLRQKHLRLDLFRGQSFM